MMLSNAKCKMCIMQGGALEDGRKLYEQIAKLPNITSSFFGDVSPVLGVHTGPGLLGVIYLKDPIMD